MLFLTGKPEEARQLATQAAAKMKPLPNDAKNPLAGGGNEDDLILWLAYREAKDAIKFDEKGGTGAKPGTWNKAKAAKKETASKRRGAQGSADLSPLKDLPLKSISGNYQLARDDKFLHAIKTLETINDKPVADFWKEMNLP